MSEADDTPGWEWVVHTSVEAFRDALDEARDTAERRRILERDEVPEPYTASPETVTEWEEGMKFGHAELDGDRALYLCPKGGGSDETMASTVYVQNLENEA